MSNDKHETNASSQFPPVRGGSPEQPPDAGLFAFRNVDRLGQQDVITHFVSALFDGHDHA